MAGNPEEFTSFKASKTDQATLGLNSKS